MKRKDDVPKIIEDIMTNDNYINFLASSIKVFHMSIDLYLASMEKDTTYEENMKLREIIEESQGIIKSIDCFKGWN